jgi:hypothetical protein
MFENIQLKHNSSPEKVIYYLNVNKDNAISGFINGKYDDLSFYDLLLGEREKVKPYAQFIAVFTQKVYTLIINPNRIKNKSDRIQFISAIDWDKLRNDCYPRNKRAYSFVPIGFLGYKSKPSSSTKKYFEEIYGQTNLKFHNSKKKYKILIPSQLESNQCVKDNFEKAGENFSGWHINIVSHLELLELWKKNQIDAIFVWMEDKSSLNFLSYFNPDSKILLGKVKNNEFNKIYEKFDKEINITDKAILAGEIDDYILSLATAFPVFHPSVNVVYSNRLNLVNFGTNLSYSIPFSFITLKD